MRGSPRQRAFAERPSARNCTKDSHFWGPLRIRISDGRLSRKETFASGRRLFLGGISLLTWPAAFFVVLIHGHGAIEHHAEGGAPPLSAIPYLS
jgi:hypothetical protein